MARTATVWVLVVPTLAQLMVLLPESIRIAAWNLDVHPSLPNNLVALYLSAILFLFANLIVTIRCPKIIRFRETSDADARAMQIKAAMIDLLEPRQWLTRSARGKAVDLKNAQAYEFLRRFTQFGEASERVLGSPIACLMSLREAKVREDMLEEAQDFVMRKAEQSRQGSRILGNIAGLLGWGILLGLGIQNLAVVLRAA